MNIDPFKEVIIKHPKSRLTVGIIPFGLTITRISCDDETNFIVGPSNLKDHWKKGRKFFGPIVGRYANRLPSGKIKFDNDKFLELEEFGGQGISHHGGPEIHENELPEIPEGKILHQFGPLDRIIWTKISSNRSRLFGLESPSNPSNSSAIFSVISQGANEENSKGFPGTLLFEVRFAIELKSTSPPDTIDLGLCFGALIIEYRAEIIDNNCLATPLNLTHHWTFNLSKERNTIDKHNLRIFSNNENLFTLELDENQIPNGELLNVKNDKRHDWQQKGELGFGKFIIQDENSKNLGYDHFYSWGSAEDSILPTRLLLHESNSNYSLLFLTNQSGVQLYTLNGQPEKSSTKGELEEIHKREGIAIEFSHPHGTFLYENYKNLANSDTILRKNDRYSNIVELQIWKSR